MKKQIIKLLTVLTVFFSLVNPVFAEPSITSTSDVLTHGQSIEINGSGFGVKSTAAPIRWENFENGIAGSSITTTGYWSLGGFNADVKFSNTNPRTSLSPTFAKDQLTDAWPPVNSNGAFYRLDLWPSPGKKLFTGYVKIEHVNLLNTGSWQLKLIHVLSGSNHIDWPVLALQTWWSPGGSIEQSYFEFVHADGGMLPSEWKDFVDKNAWVRFQVEWQDSTSYSIDDGWARFTSYYPNGTVVSSVRSGFSTIESDGDHLDTPHFGYLLVNNPDGHQVNTSWDDLYLDNSWARVEICAGSTWASRGNCEIQNPTAWNSDGQSITATVNLGSFGAADSAHLYIVDAAGTANASGFPITLGSESSDPAAPSSPTNLAVL